MQEVCLKCENNPQNCMVWYPRRS